VPAEPLIITAAGSIESVDPGPVLVGDPDGFDTVTGHYFFPNTTADQLRELYPIGDTSATLPDFTLGTNMVCFGASDIKELPGRYCTAAITFRGLLNTDGTRAAQYEETSSVREKTYASLAGIPGVSGSPPARILEQQGGLSVRLISFKKPLRPTTSANGQLPTGIITTIPAQFDIANVPKTYCYPNGWICYNWQSKQVLPGIWFVTADYKYEDNYTYA
jgi:hypothetical protein